MAAFFSLFVCNSCLWASQIGDWGRRGADHQQEVADSMAEYALAHPPEFVISTGDNFYPGVGREAV
jgi:hypothetical protein